MKALGIILGVVFLIVLVVMLIGYLIYKWRKNEFKDWVVGDLLLLDQTSKYSSILRENKKEMATLNGWTENYLYIECGDGLVRKVRWSCLNLNKSAYWRRNYNEAKKIMGVEPNFRKHIIETDETIVTRSGGTYNGKVIELMNETECQVYLKMAIDNEDYTAAVLIKKRLEKFR